ncbi:MAG: RNA polymerase subunit sigma [Xanthomonadales bacterium]|nr:RNA polymerase subunit sigma [Xanthomonadales bacterium]
MTDLTELLVRARDGAPKHLADVRAALQPQLQRMAETRLPRRYETLTPTVLVLEAWLAVARNRVIETIDRRHFFACAARAMRAIALEHAQQRTRGTNGNGSAALDDDIAGVPALADSQLFAIDTALDALERSEPRQCEIVELNFFAGLDWAEIGDLLGISEAAARREGERAHAFLDDSIARQEALDVPRMRSSRADRG